jgi:hypothetical protein
VSTGHSLDPDLLATIVAGTQRITASRRVQEPLDALERRAAGGGAARRSLRVAPAPARTGST